MRPVAAATNVNNLAGSNSMADMGSSFALKSTPDDSFIIALNPDLDTYGFSPPFDKTRWKHVGMVELTPGKLRKFAYKPSDIIQAMASVGHYTVAPQTYRNLQDDSSGH